MEKEYSKIDEDYLEAFNTGYEISKETGLKSETLDKLSSKQLKNMNIDISQLNIIKEGMKQYVKDKSYLRAKAIKKEREKKTVEQSKGRGLSR